MQLPEFMARGYNAVADRASVAADRAKERLVVVGGYSPSLSIKWALVGLLIAFVAGFFLAVRMDFAHFHEFRAKAAALAAEKEAKNRKLEADLAQLRAELDRIESGRDASDQDFVDVINRPDGAKCTVSTDVINALIREANK